MEKYESDSSGKFRSIRFIEIDETNNGQNFQINDRNPILLDISEVKKKLSLGNNKVYNFIRENDIPYTRIGNKYKVYKHGIDDWIEKNLNRNKK